MPKRFSKGWQPKEVRRLAHQVVRVSTEDNIESIEKYTKLSQSEISRVMAAMGRRGGRIGGKRRLVTMTPERRREIARRAARKRWDNKKKAS